MATTFRELKAGPDTYFNDTLKIKNQSPRATISKTSRDISFSKYNAVHSELVTKGLNWKSIKSNNSSQFLEINKF